MADKQVTDKPMELPAELGDWREVLRLLHTGLKPQAAQTGPAGPAIASPMNDMADRIKGLMESKPPVKGVHVTMVAVAKPKDGKEAKKKDASPIDMTSPLEADGSPLRMMLNAVRAGKKKSNA